MLCKVKDKSPNGKATRKKKPQLRDFPSTIRGNPLPLPKILRYFADEKKGISVNI